MNTKHCPVRARIIVARAPDAETESKILEFIHSRGCETAVYEIDESILGGIIIHIGDTVFDGSVKTRLEKIKHGVIA